MVPAMACRTGFDSDATTLEALRGPNASDVRKALALSMIDDRDTAAQLARKHGFLASTSPTDCTCRSGSRRRVPPPSTSPRAMFAPAAAANLTNLSPTDRQGLAGRFALIEGMSYAETRRRIDGNLS